MTLVLCSLSVGPFIFEHNKTPFAIGTSRRGFVFGGSNDLSILVTSILYHDYSKN